MSHDAVTLIELWTTDGPPSCMRLSYPQPQPGGGSWPYKFDSGEDDTLKPERRSHNLAVGNLGVIGRSGVSGSGEL